MSVGLKGGKGQDRREKLFTLRLASNTASVSQSQLRWINNGKVGLEKEELEI